MKATFRKNSGMTLVELLIVLAILVGVMTSVSVSASGMLDRARVDKAKRQGESMRDALTRCDGLNLSQDLGIALTATQPGELGLLASRLFRHNTQRSDGVIDTDNPGDLCIVPLFRQHSALELAYSITNNPPGIAELKTFLTLSGASNLWNKITVGGGWRGPYSFAATLNSSTQLLEDPFGGTWDIVEEDGMLSLLSLGRDHLPMDDSLADTNDWRNADLKFPFSPTNNLVSLHVEIDFSGTSSNETTLASIHCLSPKLNAEQTDGDGNCLMTPAAYTHYSLPVTASGGSGEFSENLTQGNWAIFVCAGTGANSWAAPVRVLALSPGRNSVRFTLSKL